MSSKNKKMKKRINVIDVIIILLVLALVATVVFKLYTKISNSPSNKHSKYVITFECDDQYNSLIGHLKNGEAVYLEADGTLIGYIDGEVKKLESNQSETGGNQNNAVSRLSGAINLASNAVKAKSGDYYTIEDVTISKGSKLKVYTEKAIFTLTVKNISVQPE